MAKELKPWVASLTNTIKKGWVYILLILVAGGVYFGMKNSSRKVAGTSQKVESVTAVSSFSEEKITTSNRHALPTGNPSNNGVSITWQVMEWNAQFPLMYANGGVRTTKGSLFDENGINCEIKRQDDCNQTIKDFQDNAQLLYEGKTQVPLLVSFMGDGIPGMSAALNQIKKYKGHKAIAFYAMGRSNGEDCFWGPAEWAHNPQACLGKGILGVERDGDLNIVLHWAHDNGVNINANTKVWDSSALNIIACSDFNTDLTSKILNDYHEDREIVRNGQTVPGSKHTLYCDAFTTWTPADVTVAKKKGGFSRLASTADYTMQMPCVTLIDGWWAEKHPKEMCAIIKSLGLAGDQVRSFPDAQEFAAKVSALVYKDQDVNYWLKYYRGAANELDKKGNRVFLGGSQSFNLADAAMVMGMGNEATPIDRYHLTYDMFGNILTKLYPEQMKGMTPYDDIVDNSYLRTVLQNNDSLRNGKTESSTAVYASGSAVTEQVSSRSLDGKSLKFAVGSSAIDKSSYSTLNDVFNSAMQSDNALTLFIYGHTDALGDAKDNGESNRQLSLRRAEAVRDYLVNVKHLNSSRVQVKGVGSSSPVAITNNDPNDVRNRCVEFILGH